MPGFSPPERFLIQATSAIVDALCCLAFLGSIAAACIMAGA